MGVCMAINGDEIDKEKCIERREGMDEMHMVMKEMRIDIIAIKKCLMGDIANYEKPGVVTRVSNCEQMILKHIDTHWKFTTIILSVTGGFMALITLINDFFKGHK